MVHPCPICDLEPQVLTCGTVELDRRTCSVRIDGRDTHVRRGEFEVLELLMTDPGRVWSKGDLYRQMDPLGMREFSSRGEVIDQHLHRLRKRLGGAAKIVNRWGYGWLIEPTQEA